LNCDIRPEKSSVLQFRAFLLQFLCILFRIGETVKKLITGILPVKTSYLKSSFFCLAVSCLLVAAGLVAAEPEKFSSRLRFFTEDRGLPHNRVNVILQTADQYLWYGTDAGLVRWDGVKTAVFSKWTTPNLENDRIISLHEDSRHILWIGTAGGGLYSYENGRIQSENDLAFLFKRHVQAIISDKQGYLWVGTDYGLYRLRDETYRRFSIDDGLLDNIITSLAVDSAGYVWAGTQQGGIAKFREEFIQVFYRKEGLSQPAVMSLGVDEFSCLWIGTLNGLYKLEQNENIMRVVKGLAYTPVTAILPIPDEGVWIGTMADSLKLYKNGSFENIRQFPDRYVRSLCKIVRGPLMAGTDSKGLVEIQNRQNDICRLTTVSQDLAVARRGPGLGILAAMRREFPQAGNYTAYFEDKTGVAWIGTEQGLLRYKDGRLIKISELSAEKIRVITGSEKKLFIGTETGVYEKKDGVFINVLQAGKGENFQVEALCVAGEGLWIGTSGSGLKYLNNESFEIYSTLDGLPDNFIFNLLLAKEHSLWMTCRKGLFCLHVDSLAGYTTGKIQTLNPIWLDEKDGLPVELLHNQSDSHLSQQDSLLYLSNPQIAVAVNTNKLKADASKPSCRIESLQADGKFFLPAALVRLPALTRHLKIGFTGFDFGAAEKMWFYYRLQGREAEFQMIEPGALRQVEYRNLSTRIVNFELYAVNSRGQHSRIERIEIRINRPFYGRLVFILPVAGILFLLTGYFSLKRKQRPIQKTTIKYQTTSVNPERAEKAKEQLNFQINEEKIFLDPDLSLKSLARKLKIHPNYLSRIINEHYNMSFNDFINRCRIETAKEKLTDPDLVNKSILEIMFDSGFYSKSVFNTAFKKFSDTTPSQYRKAKKIGTE